MKLQTYLTVLSKYFFYRMKLRKYLKKKSKLSETNNALQERNDRKYKTELLE